MKKSSELDKQCLQKILAYILDIKDCLKDFNINSHMDLEQSKYAKYTITQLITNINELSKKLQADTLNSLKEFNQVDTSLARNIASHSYEKVNFKFIYRICIKLIDDTVYNEVSNFIGVDNNDNNI